MNNRPDQQRAQPRAQPNNGQVREATRETANGVTVRGRTGEMLSRKRKDDGTDQFDIPRDLIPPDWEYQWMAVSVNGSQAEVADHNLIFYENGWRPVPSDRHEGRFMPIGHKGNIIRGGQMLMERPKALSDEARDEMKEKAIRQMRDRDEALMGGAAGLSRAAQANGVPLTNRFRGRKAFNNLNMSIDPALDIPSPSLPLAEPGE